MHRIKALRRSKGARSWDPRRLPVEQLLEAMAQ